MIKAALTLIGINILAIFLMQWFIDFHNRPAEITAFGKVYRVISIDNQKRYAKVIVLNSTNDTITQCEGSTDLVNDGVHIYWWDFDNDGNNELYFAETFDGDYYLKFSPDKIPQKIKVDKINALPGAKSLFFPMIYDTLFGPSYGMFIIFIYGIILGIILLLLGIIIRIYKKKKVQA